MLAAFNNRRTHIAAAISALVVAFVVYLVASNHSADESRLSTPMGGTAATSEDRALDGGLLQVRRSATETTVVSGPSGVEMVHIRLVDSSTGKPPVKGTMVRVLGETHQTCRDGLIGPVAVRLPVSENQIEVLGRRSFAHEPLVCSLELKGAIGGLRLLEAAAPITTQITVIPRMLCDYSKSQMVIVEILSIPSSEWMGPNAGDAAYSLDLRSSVRRAKARNGDPELRIEEEHFQSVGSQQQVEPFTFRTTLGEDLLLGITVAQADGTRSSCVPVSLRYSVDRGEALTLRVDMVPRPVIVGFLVDEKGRPLARKTVTVAVRRAMASGELLPQWVGEPLSPAFIVMGNRLTSTATAICQLSVTTNADGSFSVALPLSGTGAAWAFVAGHGLAYREFIVQGEHSGPVELIANSALGRPRAVQLVSADGEALGNFSFDVIEVDPPHPFQLSYPKISTRSDGFIDINWLSRSRCYALFPDSTEFPMQRVYWSADTLVLESNASAQDK